MAIVQNASKVQCGVIMPISEADGYSAEHWASVYTIIKEAVTSIENVDFEVRLVSEDNKTHVIQKTILQKLYNSSIVVCDVSGRNPNVMFELGMRLAFDKPTIVIKDDATPYSFDTQPIEHLSYPRALTYQAIVAFKLQLAEKVTNTFLSSLQPNHLTFLKSFGEFHVASLDVNTLPTDKAILENLNKLMADVADIKGQLRLPLLKLPKLSSGDGEAYMELAKFGIRFAEEQIPEWFDSPLGREFFQRYYEFLPNKQFQFSSPEAVNQSVEYVAETMSRAQAKALGGNGVDVRSEP